MVGKMVGDTDYVKEKGEGFRIGCEEIEGCRC